MNHIKLSHAEIQAFQQIEAQRRQLEQQQALITMSILESRGIDVSSVEQSIRLSDDGKVLMYSLKE